MKMPPHNITVWDAKMYFIFDRRIRRKMFPDFSSKPVLRAATRLSMRFGESKAVEIMTEIGSVVLDKSEPVPGTSRFSIEAEDLAGLVSEAARLSRGDRFTFEQVKRMVARRVEMMAALPLKGGGDA